jgi:hypothetical protein
MGTPVFDPMNGLRVGVAATLLALLALPRSAAGREAAAGSETFVRVVASEAELRSGPGVSHRVVYRAERGEAFVVAGRETSGFWIEVLLPDGREVYVLGDTVEVMAIDAGADDAPSRPGFFAPPALQEARAGFALLGGAFDGAGYAELKPAFVLAPAIAFEPYLGLALEADGQRFIYGLAATLNLAPDWAIAPYVQIGAGGIRESAADEFVGSERSSWHARAGGGLLVSLRWRVLVRLEATNLVVFTEDSYENLQAYIGGLGTYF